MVFSKQALLMPCWRRDHWLYPTPLCQGQGIMRTTFCFLLDILVFTLEGLRDTPWLTWFFCEQEVENSLEKTHICLFQLVRKERKRLMFENTMNCQFKGSQTLYELLKLGIIVIGPLFLISLFDRMGCRWGQLVFSCYASLLLWCCLYTLHMLGGAYWCTLFLITIKNWKKIALG